MAKKRPLLAPQARSRLLVAVILKKPSALQEVMSIIRKGRELGRDRDYYIYKLREAVVEPAANDLERKSEGITFSPEQRKNAAGRLLRLGYRLNGEASVIRCPDRTPCNVIKSQDMTADELSNLFAEGFEEGVPGNKGDAPSGAPSLERVYSPSAKRSRKG